MPDKFSERIKTYEQMPQSDLVNRIFEIDAMGRKISDGLRKQRRKLLSVLTDDSRRQVQERRDNVKRTKSFGKQIKRYRGLFKPDTDNSKTIDGDEIVKILEGYPWHGCCVQVQRKVEGGFVVVTINNRKTVKTSEIRPSYELCVADYLRSRGISEEVIQAAMQPEADTQRSILKAVLEQTKTAEPYQQPRKEKPKAKSDLFTPDIELSKSSPGQIIKRFGDRWHIERKEKGEGFLVGFKSRDKENSYFAVRGTAFEDAVNEYLRLKTK